MLSTSSLKPEAWIFMVQFSSVTQSCPTLCGPMDCSTPGLPIHHQLLELAQLMSMQSVMPRGDAKRWKMSPTAKGRPAQPDLAGAAIRGVRPHFQSGLALWQVFGFVQIP